MRRGWRRFATFHDVGLKLNFDQSTPPTVCNLLHCLSHAISSVAGQPILRLNWLPSIPDVAINPDMITLLRKPLEFS